jgi:hypothetical protein
MGERRLDYSPPSKLHHRRQATLIPRSRGGACLNRRKRPFRENAAPLLWTCSKESDCGAESDKTGGDLFRKFNEAAYPPAAVGIAVTAKSLCLEVAINIAE